MEDRFYLAAACAVVPGLGRKRLRKLVERFGSAERVYKASLTDLTACGCTYERAAVFTSNRDQGMPQKIKTFCERSGTYILSITDAEYPYLLKQISDPPLLLYVRGVLPQGHYTAVVGSRKCTDYGEKNASVFAAALARSGITIISGGARGIDTVAHVACLKAGGTTVAVLGCGIDIAYPHENAELFNRIEASGALVTEYPPGTQPVAVNFPARNRIIVGLACEVLVAEASRKSGAIITANIAADEGRDVFCIPGNIYEGTSIGCHDLIRNGAKLVDCPEDIFSDMNKLWEVGTDFCRQNNTLGFDKYYDIKDNILAQGTFANRTSAGNENLTKMTVSELGSILLDCLHRGAMSLEELVSASGRDFGEVSVELLQLLADGRIKENAARQYRRV